MISYNGGSSWVIANSATIGPPITSVKDPDIHDAVIGMSWGGPSPTHARATINTTTAFSTTITVEAD
jgi:hypothetical protein